MTLPPDKFHRARVTERVELAPDLWKLRLNPGGEFNFVAGQYATLGMPGAEKLVERAYSICSSPYEDELEVFLELVPEGALTPKLYPLAVGDEVSLRRVAKGRFTLDFKSGRRNHLLLATVTGVAPYVSYVRTLYTDWQANRFPADIRLYMIHAASRSWEFGYREELEMFAAKVPWLKYVPCISRPWEDGAWRGETGRVEDLIRKYADAWDLAPADTTGYLCGHPSMVENGLGILARRGFDKKALQSEVYWVPEGDSSS
ncbi:MAG: ferredoxin--NADP reductase [Candidatus Acidiferrales bacterium]